MTSGVPARGRRPEEETRRLVARAVTAPDFAPYGRVLEPGRSARVALPGGALVTLEQASPPEGSIAHLTRFPETERVLLALGPEDLLLVVLDGGERPTTAPQAFAVPRGRGVALARGVWHAGPFAVAAAAFAQVLETAQAGDRVDRRPLARLVGVAAVSLEPAPRVDRTI